MKMKVQCPNCGETVVVKGIGRKRLNIPLKNVCEALQARRSVADAAQELGCSPAYIFGILKTNGLKLKDVLKERS
jgi:DNA-directed RNA polymerase subunit RPC12/RpoP